MNGIASDHININDRAIHYGDGLFETILFSANKLYYWHKHYQRLSESARRLNISCPEENLLLSDIYRLLQTNDITTGVIKIILSRGSSGRGYQYPKNITVKRLVMISAFDPVNSSILADDITQGELFLCQNRVSINSCLAGVKHLNRLENVLARNELPDERIGGDTGATRQRYADGVMLDDNDRVIECTSSNIFAIRDNQLFTPELSHAGVDGVMRDITLTVSAEIGIRSDICDLYVDELKKMDEIFITNSLIGLKSINRFLESSFSTDTTSTILTSIKDSADKYAHLF